MTAVRKLMWFALPFGAGCLLCVYLLPRAAWPWAAGAALAAGLASFLLKERSRVIVRIAAAGLAMGILWFAGYAGLYLDPAEALAGLEDLAELELAGYPEASGYGARCVVRIPGVRGKAMYYGGYDLLELEPGDTVSSVTKYYSASRLGGKDSTYYTSQGIFLRLYGDEIVSVEARDAGSLRYLPQRASHWLKETVNDLYGQRTAGFLTALLTGERDGLDTQSASDLNESGLSHITTVSGLHCTFLIALLGVLVFRRRKLTIALAYPVLLFYMVMVGCTPSVVRSCVMVGMMLLAPLFGREEDAPTALSAALLVILLANPFAVASVSLQLSFAAVAGLLGPAQNIQAALSRRRPRKLNKKGKVFWQFCTGTLSASLGVMLLTAPLNAVYFGSLSLISPAANLLVLWIAPVLFACALIGTVLCGLLPGLAALAAIPDLLSRYVLWVAGTLARVPGHAVVFTGPAIAMWLLLVYTLLGLCVLSKDHPRKYAVAFVLAAVCLIAVRAVPRLAVRNDALTAVAVDVGQGASTLLHSGDRTALVDCGSLNTPGQAGEAVADAMDTYGWDHLDYVVLTHYHADHAGGLAGLLARVEVDEMLLPQLLDGDQGDLQREVLALAEQYGVEVCFVEGPLGAALGSASLTIYPPVAEGDTNEEGVTILCSSGDFDLLITGDMNSAVEKKLIDAYPLPDIEVLMVGHHGSKYSTSKDLLEAVWPEVGIISVGESSFGHPTEEAMGRMAAAGMTLYRTDWQGNMLIRVHPEAGGANGGQEEN